mmetsp:Transcript_41753/g.104935  ORF Transcript_41753/g.104935 Transcript_41753/m.104935 type:complete len:251 (+) Transcript_41753:162-914(+)
MHSPKARSATGLDSNSLSMVSEQNLASAMLEQKREASKSACVAARDRASARKSHLEEDADDDDEDEHVDGGAHPEAAGDARQGRRRGEGVQPLRGGRGLLDPGVVGAHRWHAERRGVQHALREDAAVRRVVLGQRARPRGGDRRLLLEDSGRSRHRLQAPQLQDRLRPALRPHALPAQAQLDGGRVAPAGGDQEQARTVLGCRRQAEERRQSSDVDVHPGRPEPVVGARQENGPDQKPARILPGCREENA